MGGLLYRGHVCAAMNERGDAKSNKSRQTWASSETEKKGAVSFFKENPNLTNTPHTLAIIEKNEDRFFCFVNFVP